MFCCLLVTDFPAQAVLRLEPEPAVLKQSPVAVVEGPPALLRVMAANEKARLAGVETGMTRLQAETCGRLVVRKRSEAAEAAAQAALLDCAWGFSPRVESTAPGIAILDLAGTEKLFGPPQNVARKIVVRALDFGFELNIAVASNPDAALCAARGFAGITIIPQGEEAARLASLPVDVLSPSPEMLEILDSWGIRDLHGLAVLPPVPVTERLGQAGLQLQKLARGESLRPLVPADAAQEFVESFEFEDPVETLESLTFILSRLLHQLCARLNARSLATNEVRLRLELKCWEKHADRPENEFYERSWKLPLPVQDAKVLFRLAYLDLESSSLTAPVERLIVEALPAKPRFAQGGLFNPPSPEAEQLEITLARIRGVVGVADEQGRACVGSPQVLDSHKPESFRVRSFTAEENQKLTSDLRSSAPISGKSSSAGLQDASPIIAMRMFRPPLETAVELDGESGEKPVSVVLRRRRMAVLAASGPWRSSGNWWNKSEVWARDEWDVALKTPEDIGFYRIYLDRNKRRWFVEGMFD